MLLLGKCAARACPLLISFLLLTPISAQNAQGLHSLAVAAGKLFFGTATDTNHFDDTAYMQIVNNTAEFGLVVPENSLKWEVTEPTSGNFVFTSGDGVLGLAKANKQIFRCHTLTWHSQLPSFVQNGTWTPAALTAVIQTHISHVVGHYAGACYSWDVVNEALGNNGSVESSVFFDTLGEKFIDISFAAAAQADPKAKLYYNDFGMENGGRKATGAVALVKRLQAANIKIDGVGLQAHLVVGQTPSRAKLAGVLGMFTSLGVEVALTELDIRFNKLPANDTAVQQQAADYVSVVGACLDVAKCVGVVIWEFTDKYSWIPGTFPGTGDACLWDSNLKEKPAYTSVSSLLAAAAATLSPSSATANVNSGDSAGGASKNGTRGHSKTSTSSALAMVTGPPLTKPSGVVTVSGACGMSGMMTSLSAMLALCATMLLFF